eukprot:TRINITY_DN715_c0_g1_i3.p1 TRINITY_DN715_c0_g1~~TRINITY_DN715_c0_g1_i3.p1  ORF type:complete len:536 (+),score=151.70 TRINITY_DN715_c0_g1_i3:1392-2999(+)
MKRIYQIFKTLKNTVLGRTVEATSSTTATAQSLAPTGGAPTGGATPSTTECSMLNPTSNECASSESLNEESQPEGIQYDPYKDVQRFGLEEFTAQCMELFGEEKCKSLKLAVNNLISCNNNNGDGDGDGACNNNNNNNNGDGDGACNNNNNGDGDGDGACNNNNNGDGDGDGNINNDDMPKLSIEQITAIVRCFFHFVQDVGKVFGAKKRYMMKFFLPMLHLLYMKLPKDVDKVCEDFVNELEKITLKAVSEKALIEEAFKRIKRWIKKGFHLATMPQGYISSNNMLEALNRALKSISPTKPNLAELIENILRFLEEQSKNIVKYKIRNSEEYLPVKNIPDSMTALSLSSMLVRFYMDLLKNGDESVNYSIIDGDNNKKYVVMPNVSKNITFDKTVHLLKEDNLKAATYFNNIKSTSEIMDNHVLRECLPDHLFRFGKVSFTGVDGCTCEKFAQKGWCEHHRAFLEVYGFECTRSPIVRDYDLANALGRMVIDTAPDDLTDKVSKSNKSDDNLFKSKSMEPEYPVMPEIDNSFGR